MRTKQLAAPAAVALALLLSVAAMADATYLPQVLPGGGEAGPTAGVTPTSSGTPPAGATATPTASATATHTRTPPADSTATAGATPTAGATATPTQTPVATPTTRPTGVIRVSVSSGGGQAGGQSWDRPAVSSDGRYVAFVSDAADLVANDTNGASDVFVRDTVTGTTTRVSVATDGTQAGSGVPYSSARPSISADGRFVAFESYAANLVAGDSNGASDVFVHDRTTGTTERVSVAGDGSPGNGDSLCPALSADGRYVVFASTSSNLVGGDSNGVQDVFVRDRQAGTTTKVSVSSSGQQGDGDSAYPAISADGERVAYTSSATNLVGDDSNDAADVFLYDRSSGIATRLSVATDGTEGDGDSGWGSGPAISADGHVVAFASSADNLVASDTNAAGDVFVRDLVAGVTVRVSVASDGTGADLASGQTSRPSLSAHGRYVAFSSQATNLVTGDTNAADDVFVHDCSTGVTERLSVATDGSQGNGDSAWADGPTISADGGVVAFTSAAGNLVANDTNGCADTFVRYRAQ